MPAAHYNSAAERNRKAHGQKLAASYNELVQNLYSTELTYVGNYRLGEVIGKGSFGKVYLATHTLTNTKVVLKAAPKKHHDLGNLAREIYHHRRFRYPHITRLYEVIHTETHVWLVLEYCAGGELYDYLLTQKRLPPAQVQLMFSQLVGAVVYIHQHGCVHRDLKLENILLDKYLNVKLGDFGFTREYERQKMLETWCGTYVYAAPEMIRGEKYLGEAVDVWSLGVVLFTLLVGKLPFDCDEDEISTKQAILNQDPLLPDYIPLDARSLLISLLQKSPNDRPSLTQILSDPFLSTHADQQLSILQSYQIQIPFTTPVEKSLLDKFTKCGLDVDSMVDGMDSEGGEGPLVGLWELSLDTARRREERKKRKKGGEKNKGLPGFRREEGVAERHNSKEKPKPQKESAANGKEDHGLFALNPVDEKSSRLKENVVVSSASATPNFDKIKVVPDLTLEKRKIGSKSSSRAINPGNELPSPPTPPPKKIQAFLYSEPRRPASPAKRSFQPSTSTTLIRPLLSNGDSDHKSNRKPSFFSAFKALFGDWSSNGSPHSKTKHGGKKRGRGNSQVRDRLGVHNSNAPSGIPNHSSSRASLVRVGNVGGQEVEELAKFLDSGHIGEKGRLMRKNQVPRISIQPPSAQGLQHSSESATPRQSTISNDSPRWSAGDHDSIGSQGRMSRRTRPSYRRRSTSSSINSLHSRTGHRYSHSKTSSTSSGGSTPRSLSKGSLKIVPATPPPHLLSHRGVTIDAEGVWATGDGRGVVIARRKRSPFKGPGGGFGPPGNGRGKKKMVALGMETIPGEERREKWTGREGVIHEEDEEVMIEEDEDIVSEDEGISEDEGFGEEDMDGEDTIARGPDGERNGGGNGRLTSRSV